MTHAGSSSKDWRSMYDDRLRRLVEGYYAEDLERFGYTFEQDEAASVSETANA